MPEIFWRISVKAWGTLCHNGLVTGHWWAFTPALLVTNHVAPMSASRASVVTCDKRSDAAPYTPPKVPLSISAQHNSDPQLLNAIVPVWFSQSDNAVACDTGLGNIWWEVKRIKQESVAKVGERVLVLNLYTGRFQIITLTAIRIRMIILNLLSIFYYVYFLFI